MRYPLVRLFFLAVGLTLGSGCNTCCTRPGYGPSGPFPPGPTPGGVVPDTGGAFVPPNPSIPAPPPNPSLGSSSGFNAMPSAQPDLTWRPSDSAPPQVQLRAPEPVMAAQATETPRLQPPQVSEQVTPAPPQPAASAVQTLPPSLPVGIPQYAIVKERVTTGRRPLLDDGLDWLRENGFRTVLYLRRPGDDDATDRKEAEKRGLKYLSLEVSPATLTRKLVEDFGRLANDSTGYPLFVYDRDGSLAGGLWYLHFRLNEGATDETARLRAGTLGLRDDRDSHREMWVAIRQLLVLPANP